MENVGIDLKKLGNAIRQVRTKAGLDQAEFGKKLGVAGNTVSRWEIGGMVISIESLYKIKRVYGVGIDDLLP